MSVSCADPCSLTANWGNLWVGTPMALSSCFDNIPFDLPRANSTVTLLRQLTQLYAFTDVAMNSGPPWNMQVNLSAGLDAIEANFSNYVNDYAFHSDVMRLFDSLNDGHTLYEAPVPYISCFLLRPFSVFTYYNGVQLTVTLNIGYLGANFFSQYATFDPTPYYGEELQQINGQQIVTWLQNYANQFVSVYKDPAIRFSQLFRQTSTFSVVPLGMFPLSDVSLPETWTISGTSVTVPKVVICPATANTSSWISAIDNPQLASKKKRNTENSDTIGSRSDVFLRMHSLDIHKKYQKLMEETLGAPERPPVHVSSRNTTTTKGVNKPQHQLKRSLQFATTTAFNTLPIVEGNASNLQVLGSTQMDSSAWWGLYTDQGGNTFGVLRVASFEPANNTDFMSVIDTWLNQMQTRNITYVIVDVSANGGGQVCLALFLLAALVPQWSTGAFSTNRSQQIWEPYDLRHSEIWDNLVDLDYFNTQEYRQLNGQPYFQNQWYYPGVNYTRGGVTSLYSFLSAFPYSDCYPAYFPTRTFFPKNILIVTDGTCASSCCLFATKFQIYQTGIVVSYGGLPGADMDCSSVAGGNVLEWPSFIASLSYFPNFPDRPIPFATSATTSFVQNELYMGPNVTLPREWNKFPADYHIYWWDPIFIHNVSISVGAQILATLYESASRAWGLVTTPVAPFPPPSTTLPPPPSTTAPSPTPSPGASPTVSPTSTPNSVPSSLSSSSPIPTQSTSLNPQPFFGSNGCLTEPLPIIIISLLFAFF